MVIVLIAADWQHFRNNKRSLDSNANNLLSEEIIAKIQKFL